MASSSPASAPSPQEAGQRTDRAASASPAGFKGLSGKKICCACPDTRKPRDLCVVERGEEHCRDAIEAHDACLRRDGFSVPQKVWPAQGGAAPR
jgi:cytochrome c oxidase assembly protein subunit 17